MHQEITESDISPSQCTGAGYTGASEVQLSPITKSALYYRKDTMQCGAIEELLDVMVVWYGMVSCHITETKAKLNVQRLFRKNSFVVSKFTL